MVVVFQFVKKVLYNSGLSEFQECPTVLQGKPAHEPVFYLVFLQAMVVRFGQIDKASGAKCLLSFYQGSRTCEAVVGKKQRNEVFNNGNWSGHLIYQLV
jgi:hypothetical protein